MNTAALARIRKGSHLRLVSGECLPSSRLRAGLTGVWGRKAHKQNARAPLPVRPAHRVVESGRPDVLTIQQVAARLQVSVKQVRKLVDDGDLRYINVGRGSKHRAMRFKPADVEECIRQLTKRNVPSCPSTSRRTRLTTNTTSSAEVIGFTARRNARIAGKPKR
jgi:excisionase family DNA binding protein